jgi:glyceraldehyde-3-phosphate dehydrogenase (NADP+)
LGGRRHGSEAFFYWRIAAEGTLSVSDALRVFSIRTLVAAKQTDLNKQIITSIVRDNKSKFLATDFIL